MRPKRLHIIFAILSILILILSYLLIVLIKPNYSFQNIGNTDLRFFGILAGIWIVVTYFTRKFNPKKRINKRTVISSILLANFISLGVVTILLFMVHHSGLSRLIVFGTIFLATLIECLLGLGYVMLFQSTVIDDRDEKVVPIAKDKGIDKHTFRTPDFPDIHQDAEALENSIKEEAGEQVALWMGQHINLPSPKTIVVATTTRFNIMNYPDQYLDCIVNLKQINDIQGVNKFFETVNSKLVEGGTFMGCAETNKQRKKRMYKKYPPVLNRISYGMDYLFYRSFPKIIPLDKIFFFVTRGKSRGLSYTETLGRLYSCGFELIEEKDMNDLLYWKVKKVGEPVYDTEPSYGPFIRLRRIGKDGREFKVYKIRTMHAYAEYLQSHIHKRNNIDKGGKFRNDFRITQAGKVMRKLYVDEIPMLFNVLKGDMKIMGVRPLSKHYYSLYDKELRESRTRYKPGLIPPYHTQWPRPKTLEEIQQNELEYLRAYEKHPFITDVNYFFRFLHTSLAHGILRMNGKMEKLNSPKLKVEN